MFERQHFNPGDRVIIYERGPDYGKMCTVVEASDTNYKLPIRIRLVNPYDYFKVGTGAFDKPVEKWISRERVGLYKEGDGT